MASKGERTLRYDKFKWWKSLLPLDLAYGFVYLCKWGGGP